MRYQPFNDLPASQFEVLKRDIAEKGVLQPVVVDENGVVLDGHQRVRACAELHCEYPTTVIAGLSEKEKQAYAVVVNTFRRHLSGHERAQAINKLRSLGWSTRRIAGAVGVDHSTIVRSGGASAPPDTPTPQKGSVADGPTGEGFVGAVETTPEGEPSETGDQQRLASHRKDARSGPETDPAVEGEPGEGDLVPASSPAPRVTGADGKSYPAAREKKEKPPLDSMGKRHAFSKVTGSFHDALAHVDWDDLVRAYAEGDEIDRGHLPAFASSLKRWAGEIDAALQPALRSVK